MFGLKFKRVQKYFNSRSNKSFLINSCIEMHNFIFEFAKILLL